jgi:hypothetical protein
MTLAHATFAINTVNHMFGSPETVDESRNNPLTRCLRRVKDGATATTATARGAQRLLLVGGRHDVVRHPRDGGVGLVWDINGTETDLRRGAGGESQARDAAHEHRGCHRWPLELVEETD